jgi:hypothetical protein
MADGAHAAMRGLEIDWSKAEKRLAAACHGADAGIDGDARHLETGRASRLQIGKAPAGRGHEIRQHDTDVEGMDRKGERAGAALPEKLFALRQRLGEPANGLAPALFFVVKLDHSQGSWRFGVA